MPVPLTYPGVYIEEIQSGVRTITGVATSITAFIGRALRGPVNEPITITSLADFERIFGGLWVESSLGYAVRDFYLNGGNQAIIVRIFNPLDEVAQVAVDMADSILELVPEPANDQQTLTDAQATAVTNAINGVMSSESGEKLSQAKKIKDIILPLTVATTKVTDFRTAVTNAKNAIGQTKAHFDVTGLSNAANIALKTANDTVSASKTAIQDLKDSDALKQGDVDKIKQALNNAPNDIKTDSDVTSKNVVGTPAGVIRAALNNVLKTFVAKTVSDEDDHPLKLKAASEGSWGKNLRARVTYPDDKTAKEIADNLGVNQDDVFNLSIQDSSTGVIESFRNVTVKDSIRRVDKVLENGSNLVRFDGDMPSNNQVRPGAHSSPEPGKGVWDENIPPTFSKVVSDITDGNRLMPDDMINPGLKDRKHGLFALDKADIFNILCIPPFNRDGDAWVPSQTVYGVYPDAMEYCADRRAMLIVDPPADWSTNKEMAVANAIKGLSDLGLSGTFARNAALFFPRIQESDLLRNGRPEYFAPCGMVAGIWARTDTLRGVWKAPAGLDASLNGILGLETVLSDDENGRLNPLGINCLRDFKVLGRVVWGARTMRGADQLADEWKYIPVRRIALFIEESLYRGTQWIVFEPNDEPLWAQIRLNVGAFMHSLFRQGAFQGTTPRDAYFVKCDKETTTQDDINKGIVNIRVGFAPLKPAEFVVIQIQQMAGQIQT